MMDTLLSEKQLTIAAAEALHTEELFNPAAVFDTGEGFVYGRLREMECPPHETARAIEKMNGYKMVTYCDPLLNTWHRYEPK